MKTPLLLAICSLLLTFRASAAVNLKDALDGEGLVWTTAGWAGQTTTRHDGVDAAQSGTLSDSTENWVETKVTGPGTLSFWWKVSSEVNFDWFRFQVDGVFKDQASGEENWAQKTFPIAEGLHVLRWRYIKDANGAEGTDQAWLDEVTFQTSTGIPSVALQPLDQVVWEGATVTFDAVVLGSAPFAYQWFFNETVAIPGATNSSWTISNSVPENIGTYTLQVSNQSGVATTRSALLSMTNPAPALKALLLVDGSMGSPFEIALTQLAIPYTKYTSETSFNQAIGSAAAASTLVILDAFDGPHEISSSVTAFIRRGGRVLAQVYTIVGTPTLATALGVVIERRLTAPASVYEWSGSALFNGLTTPLSFLDYGFNEDGQRFHVLPGAFGLAGSAAKPAAGQAAIVAANGGRTLINGFYSPTFAHSGDAVRFAVNQLLFLTRPVSGTAPVIQLQPRDETAISGAQISLQLTASGGNPVSYQWLRDNTPVAGATGAVYRILDASAARAGRYRAVVSNVWGVVESQEATLRVTTNGPVKRILLFTDPAGSSGYPQALTTFLPGRGVERKNYADAGTFQLALSQSSPGDTLAIVEAPQTAYGFDALAEFVRHGGRAILHYWNMQAARELANAFGVTVVETLTTVNPLYSWIDHPIAEGIDFPFQFGDINNISGQRFRLLEGSIGLGGFNQTPVNAQAGIVLGNRGRSLLNGFFLPEILDSGSATQFALNELNFFFAPTPPVIAVELASNRQGITLNFDTFAGINYQLESAEDPAGPWKQEAGIVSGDGTRKTVTLPFGEPQQFYRVR